MKLKAFSCDLCGGSADQQVKFYNLDERIARGAPKAFDVCDLCSFCYREVSLFLDSLIQTTKK